MGSTTFTRDITQAYIQSTHDCECEVYIRAVDEMELPRDTVLRVVKRLNGIPGSGLQWYRTNLDHQINCLGMYRTTTDPSTLLRTDEGERKDAVASRSMTVLLLGRNLSVRIHGDPQGQKKTENVPLLRDDYLQQFEPESSR